MFIDGDDLHPPANIAKIMRGESLNDQDRFPWLSEVARRLAPGTIIACSALKCAYRDLIRSEASHPVAFLYLRGQRNTLVERMHQREGHFMPVVLLDNQLATLEEPTQSELAIVVDIEESQGVLVERLCKQMIFARIS